MVLMAWVLLILGHADAAVLRMDAALERADSVNHAHTHAYAWYYASVLHALRGEPRIAQGFAERCRAISEQHGFGHWLGLSRAIRAICVAILDDSADCLNEVRLHWKIINALAINLALRRSLCCCVPPYCSATSPRRRWR